jgi:TonB family protein
MNRLERECLAASLVAHTVLLVVLVVGAGFSAPEKPSEEVTLLTFIPDHLTDSPFQGGGSPSPPPAQPTPPVVPPPAHPPPPAPEPEPKPPPRVEPPPQSKPAPKPPAPEPVPEPAPPLRRIEPSLKPVTRPPERTRVDREEAAARERAQAEAEARRRAEIRGQRVNRLVAGLQQNLSSSTSVTVPGTGGATYASYSSFVDLIYRTAWAPLKPREAAEANASVLVRVVIARDGTVVSSDIRRRSGNGPLDQSVRAALDRVRTIGRPFPEGARDAQREFDIEFNLQSTGPAN